MTKFERDALNKKKADLQRRESFSIIPDDLDDNSDGHVMDEREIQRERKRKRNQHLFENGNMNLRKMIFMGDEESEEYSEEEEEEEESEEEVPEKAESVKVHEVKEVNIKIDAPVEENKSN